MALLLHQMIDSGSCDLAVRVFDGRRLMAIASRAGGTDTLHPTIRSFFHGPAIRCDVTGQLLGGFLRSDSPAKRERVRRGAVWFAHPVAGLPLLPVRITFTNRWLGPAMMYLTDVTAGPQPLPSTSADLVLPPPAADLRQRGQRTDRGQAACPARHVRRAVAPEGEHRDDPGGPRRRDVVGMVAEHDRAFRATADRLDCREQVARIGFSNLERVGARDRPEPGVKPKRSEQPPGGLLRLVGADRHPPALGGEFGERLGHPGIGAGGDGNGAEIIPPEADQQGPVRVAAALRQRPGKQGGKPIAHHPRDLLRRERREVLFRQHAVQARREVRQAIDQRAVEIEKDRPCQIVALRNGN